MQRRSGPVRLPPSLHSLPSSLIGTRARAAGGAQATRATRARAASGSFGAEAVVPRTLAARALQQCLAVANEPQLDVKGPAVAPPKADPALPLPRAPETWRGCYGEE
jgi:hypothetical protein